MKHNIYADGGVQSIGFSNNNINRSVGVVEPGTYTFTTDGEEVMRCLTGILEIDNKQCLPDQEIVIEKGKTFTIIAKETSSYLCLYR